MTFAEVDSTLRAEAAIDVVRRADLIQRRPRAFSARDALVALQFEVNFLFVYACNMRDGINLSDDDHARLVLACGRIQAIAEEAVG